jgi:hypothetical protein
MDMINAGKPVALTVPAPNRAGHYPTFSGDREAAVQSVMEFEAGRVGNSSGVWRLIDELYVAVALSELSRQHTRDWSAVRAIAVATGVGTSELAVERALRRESQPPADIDEDTADPNLARLMDETLGPGLRGDLYPEMFVFGKQRRPYGAARHGLIAFGEDTDIPKEHIGLFGGFCYLDACMGKLDRLQEFTRTLRRSPGLPAPLAGLESNVDRPAVRWRPPVDSVFKGKFLTSALFSGMRMQVALDSYVQGLDIDPAAQSDLLGAMRIAAGYTTHSTGSMPMHLREMLTPLSTDDFRKSLEVGMYYASALPERFSASAVATAADHAQKGVEPSPPAQVLTGERARPRVPGAARQETHIGSQVEMLAKWSPWIWASPDNAAYALSPQLGADGHLIVRPLKFSEPGNPFSAVTLVPDRRHARYLFADEFVELCDELGLEQIALFERHDSDPTRLSPSSAQQLLAAFETNEVAARESTPPSIDF